LNSTIQILEFIQPDIDAVDRLMASQTDFNHPDLVSALSHILSSGGKRIRPAMTLLIGKHLGADSERLITLAAAIEMLHTATLVHDDLIDGSLLRRGIPTLNAKWTPGATVLTGDFIFARAAKLAADTGSLPVMTLFAQTLSTIVNGEIVQLFPVDAISAVKTTFNGYTQRQHLCLKPPVRLLQLLLVSSLLKLKRPVNSAIISEWHFK